MDDRRRVKVSKYLVRHLRHQPERLGLELEPGGWVAIDRLLAACRSRGMPISRAELEEVVATNDKRRFGLDPSGTRIRAQQGHSVPVELGYAPLEPPAVLFHGTASAFLGAILRDGLQRGRRHQAHLSPDVETARRVGARHGRPVVLAVDAAGLHRDGLQLSVSGNGVWLVDEVPPAYLRVVGADG